MLPKIRNILMATDFSQNAWFALHYAFSLSHEQQSRVTCIHVLPDIPKELSFSGGADVFFGYGPVGMAAVPTTPRESHNTRKKEQVQREWIERSIQNATDHIKSLCIKLKNQEGVSGIQAHKIIVRVGNPIEGIIDEQKNGNYDLIVMGKRGHGKLRGPRVGGVANGVVIRSTIPVLVINKESLQAKV
jgi:nucleotide-binding universal stress UspA family protein